MEREEEEEEEVAEEDTFNFLLNLFEPQLPKQKQPKQKQKQDQFAFLLDLCKITPDPADQEEQLRNCPFARESETFPTHPSPSNLPPYPHPPSKTTTPPPTKAIDTEKIIELNSDEEVEEVIMEKVETEQKGKRKLPWSMTGKGTWDEINKNERGGRGKKGFLDFVNKAAKLFKEEGEEDFDGDVLETAIKRGLELPRPRWWPPEGFK